jgi:hypothetical protein
MCLILTETREQFIADRDIICYKHVQFYKNDGDENYYLTPYRKYVVGIGHSFCSDISFLDEFTIEQGLHSFKFKKSCIADAKVEIVSIRNRNKSNYAICKCVIPKGSIYYKGLFGTEPSYASNKIKYVEIVSTIKFPMNML